MVTLKLHGPLSEEFGAEWTLDVHSPVELLQGIEANRPGFIRRIAELEQDGVSWRLITQKGTELAQEELEMGLGEVSTLDLVPIVSGSGAGLRFVVGAALFIVGGGIGALASGSSLGMLASLGTSLMFGAVSSMLTPVAKVDAATSRSDANTLESYYFSGPENTTRQGLPAPVVYGEMLTGAHVISAGFNTIDLV